MKYLRAFRMYCRTAAAYVAGTISETEARQRINAARASIGRGPIGSAGARHG